jgi:serine/threonine protein kinase
MANTVRHAGDALEPGRRDSLPDITYITTFLHRAIGTGAEGEVSETEEPQRRSSPRNSDDEPLLEPSHEAAKVREAEAVSRPEERTGRGARAESDSSGAHGSPSVHVASALAAAAAQAAARADARAARKSQQRSSQRASRRRSAARDDALDESKRGSGSGEGGKKRGSGGGKSKRSSGEGNSKRSGVESYSKRSSSEGVSKRGSGEGRNKRSSDEGRNKRSSGEGGSKRSSSEGRRSNGHGSSRVSAKRGAGTNLASSRESLASSDEEPEIESSDPQSRVARRLPRKARMGADDWQFPLGEVKIDKVIATPGQFSVISRGQWRGRTVCVKQVNIQDEVYAITEIALLKYLVHPHVLPLLGACRSKAADGQTTIVAVTEFMLGGSVADAIDELKGRASARPGWFDWAARVRTAVGAARALEYLHSNCVIHRDIKADNLLLSERGPAAVCKLADFGMARGVFGPYELGPGSEELVRKHFNSRANRQPRAQTYCGTDETMAPEMILQVGTYTTSVDVFSLGCVIVELCAARRLGSKKGFLERTVQNHFGFVLDEVRQAALPDCPAALLRLAIACISDEPDQRPAPREVREHLEALEADLRRRAGKVETVAATGSARGGAAGIAAIMDADARAQRPPEGCCVVS